MITFAQTVIDSLYLVVSGMMKIDAQLPFPAKKRYVLAVNDDNMIATIHTWTVDWFILSFEDGSDFTSRLERILPFCIIQIPIFGERAPLLHSLKP